jgi:hypothetical protein
MTDDFASLFRLIEDRTDEVSGRAARLLPPELQKRLAKLAAGDSNDEERRELLALIKEQPDLILAVVTEIQNLRDVTKVP